MRAQSRTTIDGASLPENVVMKRKQRLTVSFVASLAVLTLPVVRPCAQAPDQAPQFRASVDLIQLDVSVLDKKTHRPVHNLKKEDFTILEDGHEQPVAAFAAVEIPDS